MFAGLIADRAAIRRLRFDNSENRSFCFSGMRRWVYLVALERHLSANPITEAISGGQPQKSVAASCFYVDMIVILL